MTRTDAAATLRVPPLQSGVPFMAHAFEVLCPVSEQIWDTKYRLKAPDGTPIDRTIEDTWRRVAAAVAQPEEQSIRDDWCERPCAKWFGWAWSRSAIGRLMWPQDTAV